MSVNFRRLNLDGTCSAKPVDLEVAASGGSASISAAVGVGAPNRAADVLTIQKMLNRVPAEEGGPSPKLVEDGICGPKTNGAIKKFQQKQFGFSDGRVDPGMKTFRKLEAFDETPDWKPNLAPEAERAIPDALRLIATARAHLSTARLAFDPKLGGTGGLFGPMRAAAAAIVNRHFHLDKSANPLGDADFIDGTFSRMQVAIGHVPMGLWIFEDDPLEPPEMSYAYTYAGGYFHLRDASQVEKKKKVYLDRIYLCRRLIAYDHDTIVYAMVHELGHFVGGRGGTTDAIDDHAYAHKTGYESLLPQKAIRNADCYSQYAWEVSRHSLFRPAGHKL
ncbi:MAG: hypothetical protein DIJKHBIC_02402 [Thermoanaerobaculia bacterium]|nr:hypothetical protein [Thermoanaerobaculia bacterium]